jgi:arylsulfatase
MIRDNRFKLVVYHGHEIGELFDLRSDPWEFQNLWDDTDYAGVRFDLMKKSFDALAFAVDVGPEQVAYY